MWKLVARFSLSRKEEDFRKVNEQIKRLEADLSEEDRQVKSLRDELAKVAASVGRQTELKRNIEDNIQYRKLLEEEEKMTRTIEELEEQLISMGNLHTLEADLRRANADLQRLLSEVSFLIRPESLVFFFSTKFLTDYL